MYESIMLYAAKVYYFENNGQKNMLSIH